LQIINGEIEKKALFKNKAESNAVATHSDKKRNILRESVFYSNYSIKKVLN
jgi:hypothetical protein